MYKGCATLDEELLPDLLQASSRLQMVPLLADVEQLLVDRLCAANAISTGILGDALSRPTLVDAARGAVVKSFTEASATPDFLRVPVVWLESLLADDKLGEAGGGREELMLIKCTVMSIAPPPARRASTRTPVRKAGVQVVLIGSLFLWFVGPRPDDSDSLLRAEAVQP